MKQVASLEIKVHAGLLPARQAKHMALTVSYLQYSLNADWTGRVAGKQGSVSRCGRGLRDQAFH